MSETLPSDREGRELVTLSLAAIGTVSGDIGTNPIYTRWRCGPTTPERGDHRTDAPWRVPLSHL